MDYSLKDQNFSKELNNYLKLHTYKFLNYTGSFLQQRETDLISSMNSILINVISILNRRIVFC